MRHQFAIVVSNEITDPKKREREYGKLYLREWRKVNRERLLEQRRRKYREDPEYFREKGRLYYWRNQEKCVRQARERRAKVTPEQKAQWRLNKKRRALELIGGTKCVYCGCDDLAMLEVNHRDGRGSEDYKSHGYYIYGRIISGERKTDDLETTCRVCNALHYLRLKYPESASRFQVIWHGIILREKAK